MSWFWLGLLVVCVTVTLTEGECHCSTTQLCSQFPSTPCSQMEGQDKCQEGWFGRYCQKQNIALGRSCSQSSTLNGDTTKYGAALGVDGRATTNANSQPLTCAHSKKETNPNWTVNLNTSVPEKIQHIRLYIRGNLQERSNGMQILVGNQMCYNWPLTEHPPPIVDVNCRQFAVTGGLLKIVTNSVGALAELMYVTRLLVTVLVDVAQVIMEPTAKQHVQMVTMVRTMASSVATVWMVMFVSRQMERVLEDVQQGG